MLTEENNSTRPTHFTLALALLNPTVGDVAGNQKKIIAARAEAGALGADLMLTTELVTSGYPPEDLVLKPSFQRDIHKAIETIAADTTPNLPDVLLSTPWKDEGSGLLYSAVALVSEGRVTSLTKKHDLPNYGPFDEKRVFTAGRLPDPLLWRGIRIGVPVCEDVWTPAVCRHLKEQGAEILLSPNGSPYEYKKNDIRLGLVRARAQENGIPMVYLNQFGGQDELVFDGGAILADHRGELVGCAPRWKEGIYLVKFALDESTGDWHITESPPELSAREDEHDEAEIYTALVTGLRDYVNKNGFKGVVLGMSGGIDSALSAAIATDALGAQRVRCVMMPSPYTSQISLDDAAACSKALGCSYEIINIQPAMDAYDTLLNHPEGITAENIQARARGMLLMGISNATGFMVLSTGNKSEMSVGYATLYGDMCGGYSVLKDVYKTTVFTLARYRNTWQGGEVIPDRIITRPPSAELREDQVDEDSLPPYEQLDAILRGLVERELSEEDLIAQGHDASTVRRVWKLLDNAEYKRRQAAPGVKITPRSFGKDRRYPITNRYLAGKA